MHLPIALLLSLLLWSPTLGHVLDGRVDVVVAALRYLAVFAFSHVGVSALARLVRVYARTADVHGGEEDPDLGDGVVEPAFPRG